LFENGVLRRIFGSEREEVRGGWRKLLDEENHSLYTSSNIISINKSMRMRLAGHVTRMKDVRNGNIILVVEPQGKTPLGKPRRRYKDNIKMVLREIGSEGVDWIHLAEDRDRWRAIVNTVMNLLVS
jgi:hypothetical protein